jgi:two-component system, LytTR family, response regulator
MINCIIIDDEPHNVEIIKSYVSRLNYLHLAFATTDPIEGLNFINEHQPDLIFLDIQMEELSGLQLASIIKDKSKIVFTTANSAFAIEAIAIGMLDYLVKPIKFDRFLQAVQRAVDNAAKTAEASLPQDKDIFVKIDNKGKSVKIKLDEIYYCQGMSNYIAIHTANGIVMPLISFGELEKKLAVPNFIRIHKSYLVAYQHIVGIEGGEVIVKTEKKNMNIPIGPSYRDKLMAIINVVERK